MRKVGYRFFFGSGRPGSFFARENERGGRGLLAVPAAAQAQRKCCNFVVVVVTEHRTLGGTRSPWWCSRHVSVPPVATRGAPAGEPLAPGTAAAYPSILLLLLLLLLLMMVVLLLFICVSGVLCLPKTNVSDLNRWAW